MVKLHLVAEKHIGLVYDDQNDHDAVTYAANQLNLTIKHLQSSAGFNYFIVWDTALEKARQLFEIVSMEAANVDRMRYSRGRL